MSAASAAQAAQAAAQASQQVLESTEALRRSDLLRSLIQKPDVFKPETRESEVDGWTEWRHGMMNYLGVIDPGFIKDLAEVEANPTRTPDMSGMDGAQARRCVELYSILQSFLRHRPAKLVRAVTNNNGYEGWRVLISELQPCSRQRQLALANQLSNVKFDAKVSLAEQLSRYEEIIREYERISGTKYNEDLKFLCSLRFVLLCFNWHAPCMARTTAKPQLRMHARFSSLHSNFHALAFHAFALLWSALRLGSTFSQQHTHAAHELETRLFRGSLDGFGGLCCACGSA